MIPRAYPFGRSKAEQCGCLSRGNCHLSGRKLWRTNQLEQRLVRSPIDFNTCDLPGRRLLRTCDGMPHPVKLPGLATSIGQLRHIWNRILPVLASVKGISRYHTHYISRFYDHSIKVWGNRAKPDLVSRHLVGGFLSTVKKFNFIEKIGTHRCSQVPKV